MDVNFWTISIVVCLVLAFGCWFFKREPTFSNDEKAYIDFLVRQVKYHKINTSKGVKNFLYDSWGMDPNQAKPRLQCSPKVVVTDGRAITKEVIRILKEESNKQAFR